MYGSETMIWKEKERSKIRAVQMVNFTYLPGVRRMDKIPNARIRVLSRKTKGLMRKFSGGFDMWRK